MASGAYKPAAVCRRGHTITTDMTRHPFSEHCGECGARVLTNCLACGHSIRGYYDIPNVYYSEDYTPPNFCHNCGAPYPWAGRQARIYELQNRLDEEDLEPADQLVVREQLEALLDPELDEQEQVKRWSRIKAVAPRFFDRQLVRDIFETLATAAIKSQVG